MTNPKLMVFWRVLISAVTGVASSFALAQIFFELNSRTFTDQMFLVFIPAIAIFVCLLYLLPIFEKSLEGTFFPARGFIFTWALVSVFLSLLITNYSFISLLLLLVISLLHLPYKVFSKQAGGGVFLAHGYLLSSLVPC